MTINKFMKILCGECPQFFNPEDVLFSIIDDTTIEIFYQNHSRKFFVEHDEWFPVEFIDDNEEDTYELFTTRNLMDYFVNFEEYYMRRRRSYIAYRNV